MLQRQRKYFFDEKIVRENIHKFTSNKDLLKWMGFEINQRVYESLRIFLNRRGIDYSHFTKSGKGKKYGPHRSIEEYLRKNRNPASNSWLRKRLVSEGFFKEFCYSCHRKNWRGKPIALELHHIDGDNTNNLIKNLTILCPNCHSQTDSWKGKNQSVYKFNSRKLTSFSKTGQVKRYKSGQKRGSIYWPEAKKNYEEQNYLP